MSPTGVYPRRPVEERFWAKVDKRGPDDCWPWLAGRYASGYGSFNSSTSKYAHRVAYEICVGPIPDGMQLDHLCRNRACVNPAHLEPVTNRENILRGVSPAATRAQQTHCYRGHELSEANTYTNRHGWRSCRTCRRAIGNAWYARKGKILRAERRAAA